MNPFEKKKPVVTETETEADPYADIPMADQKAMGLIRPLGEKLKLLIGFFKGDGQLNTLDHLMAELYRHERAVANESNTGKFELPDRAKVNQQINQLVKKGRVRPVKGKKATWTLVETDEPDTDH